MPSVPFQTVSWLEVEQERSPALSELNEAQIEQAVSKLGAIKETNLVSKAVDAFCDASQLFKWLVDNFAQSMAQIGYQVQWPSILSPKTWRSVFAAGPLTQRSVETFVDLAIANVGEDEDRMNTLYNFSSVMATYAPLFPLLSGHRQREPSFTELLDTVKRLEEELVKQPNAPDKLAAVQREQETISMLNDEATSMEQSQLAQLKAICRTGVFVVDARSAHDVLVEPENLVQLHYRMIGEAESEQAAKPPQVLKLKQLKELHSNCLIIAHMMAEDLDSKRTINYFSEVLEAVMYFVQLFIEHWEAGNLFFANMKSEFFFGDKRKVKASVELHPKHGQAKQLKGKGSELLVQLEHLCTFLKDAADRWKAFVRGIRDNYPPLCFYTSLQILKLREKLAILSALPADVVDGRLDMELQMLLMALKSDVSFRDVRAAMTEARAAMQAPDEGPDDAKLRLTQHQRQKEQVAALIDLGYEEGLAARAVVECGEDAIEDEYILWITEHQAGTNTKAESKKAAPTVVEHATMLLKLVDAEKTEKGNRNLTEQLARIFNAYLSQQEEEQELSREFLGLEELGRILRLLYEPPPPQGRLHPSQLAGEEPAEPGAGGPSQPAPLRIQPLPQEQGSRGGLPQRLSLLPQQQHRGAWPLHQAHPTRATAQSLLHPLYRAAGRRRQQ